MIMEGWKLANTGATINANDDGAIYNSFAGNKDYIIKDIGDEFECTYQEGSLSITVGTGKAIIGGRGAYVEESGTIELPSNSTVYLVLRADLTQTTGNELYPYASLTADISQDNLNDGTNGVRDLLLAKITTNSDGISSLVDARRISSVAGSEFDYEVDDIEGLEINEEVSFEEQEEITSATSDDTTVATVSFGGRTLTIKGIGEGTCVITVNGTRTINVSVIGG